MRKRNNNNASLGPSPSPSPGSSDDESEGSEGSLIAAQPEDDASFALQSTEPSGDGILSLRGGVFEALRCGKAPWVQCLAIYVAASLTYSYHNVGGGAGGGANVQVAIMTVITLVGATPCGSSHLIPAAIGAFVGGQNIIASTGPIEERNMFYTSNYLWLLLLSAVVGVVWCFVINNSRIKILDGHAGRLGTTTFVGMNLVMVTVYGPAGVVDWDRYYYGFVHIIHLAEEDSSLSLATAWKWTEEAELAIGYVFSVLWLGTVAGSTRLVHHNYVQRLKLKDGSFSNEEPPPAPLNNVLVPVLWALLSMLAVNALQYEHAPGLYNGFAVGSYVAMASLQKIPSVSKFASVSLFAAGWGLALTPFFVGFAGKSGFTSMLGHATQIALEGLLRRFRTMRRRRREELRLQLEQLRSEALEVSEQCRADEGAELREAPPSPPQYHHKPKRDTFYTKQQRRQQQRLKHLREEGNTRNDERSTTTESPPPKLHHRAWSALPMDGDGVWQHSLESQQDLGGVV